MYIYISTIEYIYICTYILSHIHLRKTILNLDLLKEPFEPASLEITSPVGMNLGQLINYWFLVVNY